MKEEKVNFEEGYIITEKGQRIHMPPKNGTYYEPKEAQSLVGGDIDIIQLTPATIMVINDNGKFECKINRLATEMAHSFKAIFPDDYICGSVIICPNSAIE